MDSAVNLFVCALLYPIPRANARAESVLRRLCIFQGTQSYGVFDRTLQALQPSLHLCLTEFQVRSKQTDRKIVVETDGEALSEPRTVLHEPKRAEATPCSLAFAPLRGVEWRRLVSFATTTTTTRPTITLNPNCLMYLKHVGTARALVLMCRVFEFNVMRP